MYVLEDVSPFCPHALETFPFRALSLFYRANVFPPSPFPKSARALFSVNCKRKAAVPPPASVMQMCFFLPVPRFSVPSPVVFFWSLEGKNENRRTEEEENEADFAFFSPLLFEIKSFFLSSSLWPFLYYCCFRDLPRRMVKKHFLS